jgi:flotillin
VFTIGPAVTEEALVKYARLLTVEPQDIDKLVEGIIEGESRVILASLTIEEIFKDRKAFQSKVRESIEKELAPFGILHLIQD